MYESIELDENNFIVIDGVKVFKFYPDERRVEFVDNNRFRSEKRGSRYISLSICYFLDFFADLCEKQTIDIK